MVTQRKHTRPVSTLGRGAAFALSLAMLASATARADTVNLMYGGPEYGRAVRVSLGAQSWNTYAGRLVHQTSGGTASMAGTPRNIVTFSVELLQARATAAPAVYTTTSVATTSGNTGLTNLGYAKQQAIADIYRAAAGRQFTLGLDYATAFQLALWEIVYNFDANLPNHGLSLTSGTFRVTGVNQTPLSTTIIEKVNYLFSAVGSRASTAGLVGLRSAAYQDQILFQDAVVPLPTAGWLGVCGLGLVAAVRGRRRRG